MPPLPPSGTCTTCPCSTGGNSRRARTMGSISRSPSTSRNCPCPCGPRPISYPPGSSRRAGPHGRCDLTRWRRPGLIPVILLLVVLLVALDLMSGAVQNSESLSRAFVPLMFIVIIGLLVLAAMVLTNLVRLVQGYRHKVAGSRLTGRLVLLFAPSPCCPWWSSITTPWAFCYGVSTPGSTSRSTRPWWMPSPSIRPPWISISGS